MFNTLSKWIDKIIYKLLRTHPLVEGTLTSYGVSVDDSLSFDKNPVLSATLNRQYKLEIDNNIFRVTNVNQEKQLLTVLHEESKCCFEVEYAFFEEFMVPIEETVKPNTTA